MNLRRSRALLKKIEKHFKNYDQTVWHGKNRYDDRDPKQNSCNTQHCVAGFAQMSLHRVRGMKVSSELVARAWVPRLLRRENISTSPTLRLNISSLPSALGDK